jgi:tetratricopeptide (TPR) repeat protein
MYTVTINPDNSLIDLHYGINQSTNLNNKYYFDIFSLNLSSMHERIGNFQESKTILQILIDPNNKSNKNITGASYCQLSLIYAMSGNLPEALTCLQKAKSIFTETDSTVRYNFALSMQCHYYYHNKEYYACIDSGFILLKAFFNCNNFQLVGWVFELIGSSLIKIGEYINGALFVGFSETEIAPLPRYMTQFEKERIKMIREELPMKDPDVFAAWQRGKSMNIHEAVERVLSGEIVLV